ELRGWNGDSAFTMIVPGDAPEELVAPRRRLSEVTEGSLWAGIAALSRASHLGEVSAAIEAYIEDNAPAGG
ncbi:hypothetical protein, partial [Escherichia coli]|uniref:hypothetical protein n=1 Tax=Escherichia coli TaxID=562 RepID=UPI003CE5049A